ncbi:hypothetical protein L0664_13695 [Octadecabacter sp. G9-8]|uniref:Lipoprotein n=1 Tax=Octadecabacter dasysiphoniae TaxID=2909341 RepID=A0ABS9CZ90_9RHOB|nr:hypothetical protein [Octadecabacter dasysiphoniae]MCF2872124.1 hypothetical protein [Octadecabacter dasysiphoniae]
MRAALLPIMALAACDATPDAPSGAVRYDGIETRLLDGDLVNFKVRMTNAATNDDVADYAKCAAAQYALIRGFGFARNVRTLVDEEGGIWTGDAVYTISSALPRGSRTIDAEVTVAECARRDIPTV